jgi:hypothetical protein
MVDVGTEKPPKSPEWISGAEKRKQNGAPGRRRISGGGAVLGAV